MGSVLGLFVFSVCSHCCLIYSSLNVFVYLLIPYACAFSFLGLKQVLERFENGNDVHILEVVNLIHELDGTDANTFTNEKVIEKIKRKVELDEGNIKL